MAKSYKTTKSGAIRHLLSLGAHYRKSLREDTSFAGELEHLKQIVSRLGIEKGFVVDIAAGDGVDQSCTSNFFRDPNWAGLAVEMDGRRFSKLTFLFAPLPNAMLARARVTPATIGPLLTAYEVPRDFDLLNLDIDSYDLYVMSAMLKAGFRPKIVTMEINEKLPPPIYFTVEYDADHYWHGDHFFGCSLTAAAALMKPQGYILESLQYNNAMFIRADVAGDRFDDVSEGAAYDAGYRSRADRKDVFKHNADVECLMDYSVEESVAFLRTLFKKYDGKYTLR